MTPLWAKIAPWALLVCSNVFMTYAWYGHLKGKPLALPVAILSSWLIALPEYCWRFPPTASGTASIPRRSLRQAKKRSR